MQKLEAGCVIIVGRTTAGKVFRPSDWDHRLCGVMSTFIDGKLRYSRHVRPIHHGEDKAVFIAGELKEADHQMWTFVMNFAKDTCRLNGQTFACCPNPNNAPLLQENSLTAWPLVKILQGFDFRTQDYRIWISQNATSIRNKHSQQAFQWPSPATPRPEPRAPQNPPARA